MRNNGLQNEYDIINVLNEKCVGDLPAFWKRFISSIFPMAQSDDLIHCYKEKENQKQDISIYLCGTKRNISIKSGDGVSVHTETVNRFCGFLKWLGVSDSSIEFLKLYHYGDNTIDGTGDERMNSKQLQEIYKAEIIEFNKEVNKPEILIKIIRRFISYGTPNQNSVVNCLYYGTKDGGIFCNMKHLCDFLTMKDFSYVRGVHFGPFTYNVRYRGLYVKDFPFEEKKTSNETEDLKTLENNVGRYYINIKWHSIEEDMIDFINNIHFNH